MVVTTQENGLEFLGLHVGAANVRRYFPRSMGAVELRLGDLRIQCKLEPGFWDGRPEIRDPRLGAWLKFKVARERPSRMPVSLALEKTEGDTFTLKPVLPEVKRADRQTNVA